MFRGTFTALVTPFRDGAIDVAAFEKLIETQIASGISGVVAVGTTGESPTLSHEERQELIRLAIATAKKRCLVLAGTGSNATQHAVADTKMAEKLGADGALLVAPYYNKPSQEGLFRHFKTIADATSLPIMLYNIPGRCGVDIAPDTVTRLAKECRNIVSIKEASGSVERLGSSAWLQMCFRLKFVRLSELMNAATRSWPLTCMVRCFHFSRICSLNQILCR
jgi:4-hydroxy-tetrahydrodipicolinate synthase